MKGMITPTNRRRAVRRAIGLAALLLVLLTALSSCTGSSSKNSIKVDETKLIYGEANGLSNDENATDSLKKAAEVLTSSEARDAFVAAYRGYDVNAEGFDKNADAPAREPNVEFGKKVLNKYDKNDGDSLYGALNAADMKMLIESVQSTVEIEGEKGFLEKIEIWIGNFLGGMTKTVGFGSYLVGICLFAVLVEIIMLPLGIKQQKTSIKQAQFRPKEMAIRKKYAGRNDQATQQKMGQEIQDLYTKEGYSPMSGCLPLIVQLPVLLILYNIVIDPIRYVLGYSSSFSAALKEFYTASKAAGGLGLSISSRNGTIELLSMVKEKGVEAFAGLKDFLFFGNSETVHGALVSISDKMPSFRVGNLNFGLTPGFTKTTWVLLFIPVLTFVVYYFSMKLTKKLTFQPMQAANQAQMNGCSGKMMDITMPLFSVYITFITPAIIGVYWIFRSILTTLKQFILSRLMPMPTFTEEDYKAAEREINGKNQNKKVQKSENAGKVRSLHHIDDEDYETEPKNKPAAKPVKTEEKPAEKPAGIEGAALKEDDRYAPKAEETADGETADASEQTDNSDENDG